MNAQGFEMTSGRKLVELADEALSAGEASYAWGALLHRVLASAGITDRLSPIGTGSFPSPAAIFDTFAPGGRPALRRHFERFFEVVAEPGSSLNQPLQPGDLLVRRSPGEGNLGHVAFIAAAEQWSYNQLPSAGLTPEGNQAGWYVQVVEGGARPHQLADAFARLLLDPTGRIPNDQIILRLKQDWLSGTTEVSEALETGVAPTDPRIDVGAKFALQRMLRRETSRLDASRLIAAINAGQLAGIYGDDLGAAVQVARRLGTQRWLLVPRGEDAALVLEPTNPLSAPPTIIFRGDTPDIRSNHARMDAALQKASQTFQFWQTGQLTPCDTTPGAIPVSNLVPTTICRVPPQVIPPIPPQVIPPEPPPGITPVVFMTDDGFRILSARFEPMESLTETRWVMRMMGISQNIVHRAIPFTARIGEQGVDRLTVSSEGDRFEGFLGRVPNAGDRLYVGYGSPTIPTPIVYDPGETRPPVA